MGASSYQVRQALRGLVSDAEALLAAALEAGPTERAKVVGFLEELALRVRVMHRALPLPAGGRSDSRDSPGKEEGQNPSYLELFSYDSMKDRQ